MKKETVKMSEMEETKEYFQLINIGRFLPMLKSRLV